MSKKPANFSASADDPAETIVALIERNGRILATQLQVAKLLGRTPRTLRNWAPYVPRRGDGLYDLVKVIDWWGHQYFQDDGTVHINTDYDPDK
jgi:hypothetical protein